MKSLRVFGRCQSGSTAVEFATISFAMVLVSVGTIELGRGLHLRNELSFAADRAARKILTDPTTSTSVLENEVRSAFTGSEPERLKVMIGVETVDGVQFRTVAIAYPFTLLVPGLADGAVTLSVARRTPMI